MYGSPGSWHGESSRRAIKLDSSGFDGTMQEDAEASQSEIFIQVCCDTCSMLHSSIMACPIPVYNYVKIEILNTQFGYLSYDVTCIYRF